MAGGSLGFNRLKKVSCNGYQSLKGFRQGQTNFDCIFFDSRKNLIKRAGFTH